MLLSQTTPLRPRSGAQTAFAPCRPRRLWAASRLSAQKVYAFSNQQQSKFSCPWGTLGLQPGADEHQVKAAYRRLAKKYHPDVLHTTTTHDGAAAPGTASGTPPATSLQFLNISEAYGFLMQQLRNGGAHGGEDGDGGSSSRQGNSAAFHDWYWSFRMRRTWQRQQAARQQQQQHQQPATTHDASNQPKDFVAEDSCGCTDSGSPAATQQMGMNGGAAGAGVHAAAPQNTEALRSQLAGLRHRAAIRKNRPAPTPSPAADPHAAGMTEEPVHPAFRPSGAVFAAADGPSDSADPPPTAATAAAERQPSSPAASAPTTAAPEPPVQHHAAAQEQQQPEQPAEQHHEQQAGQGAAPPRRRFVSTGSVRDALKEQLHGMRRKAALREQFEGAAADMDMATPAPSAA